MSPITDVSPSHTPRKTKNGWPIAFGNYQPPSFKVYGCICVNSQNKILLVRGKRSNIWSFPKGHLKRGESQIACARRELLEETGLTFPSKEPIGFYKFSAGSYFLFAIEDEPTPDPRDSWEIREARWVPIEEIQHLNVNVDISWFRTVLKGILTTETSASIEHKVPSISCRGDVTIDYLSSEKAHRNLSLLWRRHVPG